MTELTNMAEAWRDDVAFCSEVVQAVVEEVKELG